MGEYVEVIVDDRPAPPQAQQLPGTRSQLISYRTEEGFEVARVHQYLRPGGALGGYGRPDPKVDHDGTLRARSFGPFGRLTIEESRQLVDPQSNQPSTEHYAVVVSRNDVSLCAITVTAEPLSSSAVTASINGTFRGIINPLFPANTFIIVLSDEEGNRVNSRFNVVVTC